MQVSCKVSYSVLVSLERNGLQMEPFFEVHDTPVELLRDPSCWVEFEKMEEFLREISTFINHKDPTAFVREVGQKNFELRAWGVLDSVLKMVESPKDIFSQPERFLSYFLTPHPEVDVLESSDHQISFAVKDLPEMPFVMGYLMGAIEGLPTYMSLPQAHMEMFNDNRFALKWFDDQQSLFDETEKKRRQFHPEIVHSVMRSLQESPIDLTAVSTNDLPQHIASEAFEKMVSLEVEKRMGQWMDRQQEIDEAFFKIKNDFYKMYDYFTRAQQIITLVSPSARKASVREAMRRVDWEHVQREFPNMVESACDSILAIKEAFHESLEPSHSELNEVFADAYPEVAPVEAVVESDSSLRSVDLNELIDNVVESLNVGEHPLKIDKRWLLDKNVTVEPDSFSDAITAVLNSSVSKSNRGSEMTIVTRPAGSKVQIEITDTGSGFSSDHLERLLSDDVNDSLSPAKKIITQHHGQFSVSSREGIGSTYLIELPISS